MAKVKNVDDSYMRDLAVCASRFLSLHRCPGGRPIVGGFICPHCDYDTGHGDCGGVEGFVKERRV